MGRNTPLKHGLLSWENSNLVLSSRVAVLPCRHASHLK